MTAGPDRTDGASVPLAAEGLSRHAPAHDAAAAIARARDMKLVSVGGCVTYCIADMLAGQFGHVHRWRRPVVSMMSPPVTVGATSAQGSYAKYIAEDASKGHRAELDTGGTALIFDLSRDYFTGVIRCGDGYVTHPNQLPTLSDVPELGGPVDLEQLFGGQPYEIVDPFSETFFDLWRTATAAFVARYAPLYEHLICVSFRRTSRSAYGVGGTDGFVHPFDEGTLARDNALTDRMERFVAGLAPVRIIELPERYAFTGVTAPYGEQPMHFQPELHALAAEWLRAIVNPGDPRQGRSLIDQAFKRARAYELLLDDRDKLSERMRALEAEHYALGESRDQAVAQRDGLADEISALRASKAWRYGSSLTSWAKRLTFRR